MTTGGRQRCGETKNGVEDKRTAREERTRKEGLWEEG